MIIRSDHDLTHETLGLGRYRCDGSPFYKSTDLGWQHIWETCSQEGILNKRIMQLWHWLRKLTSPGSLVRLWPGPTQLWSRIERWWVGAGTGRERDPCSCKNAGKCDTPFRHKLEAPGHRLWGQRSLRGRCLLTQHMHSWCGHLSAGSSTATAASLGENLTK